MHEYQISMISYNTILLIIAISLLVIACLISFWVLLKVVNLEDKNNHKIKIILK